MSKKPPNQPPPSPHDPSRPQDGDEYSYEEAIGTLFDQLCNCNPAGDPSGAPNVTVSLEEVDPSVDPKGEALLAAEKYINTAAKEAAYAQVANEQAPEPAASTTEPMKPVDVQALQSAVEAQAAKPMAEMNMAASKMRESIAELSKAGKATKAAIETLLGAAGFTLIAAQKGFVKAATEYHRFVLSCCLAASLAYYGFNKDSNGFVINIVAWAFVESAKNMKSGKSG